jgi:hypothetical protein
MPVTVPQTCADAGKSWTLAQSINSRPDSGLTQAEEAAKNGVDQKRRRAEADAKDGSELEAVAQHPSARNFRRAIQSSTPIIFFIRNDSGMEARRTGTKGSNVTAANEANRTRPSGNSFVAYTLATTEKRSVVAEKSLA